MRKTTTVDCESGLSFTFTPAPRAKRKPSRKRTKRKPSRTRGVEMVMMSFGSRASRESVRVAVTDLVGAINKAARDIDTERRSRVELWESIYSYVKACGGNPLTSGPEAAIARIERAVDRLTGEDVRECVKL